jgi:hypothetical protein
MGTSFDGLDQAGERVPLRRGQVGLFVPREHAYDGQGDYGLFGVKDQRARPLVDAGWPPGGSNPMRWLALVLTESSEQQIDSRARGRLFRQAAVAVEKMPQEIGVELPDPHRRLTIVHGVADVDHDDHGGLTRRN